MRLIAAATTHVGTTRGQYLHLILLIGVGRTLALVVVEVPVTVASGERRLAAFKATSPDRGVICAVRNVFVAVSVGVNNRVSLV